MRDRVLVLNRWPRFPGTGRWENELADYGSIIPRDRFHVTYLCDPRGALGVPRDAEAVHQVATFDDAESVFAAVDGLSQNGGAFTHVIAFSEYLLELAAEIRARFGIVGPRPEYIKRFRDKHVMKSLVQRAGVRVPRWHVCHPTSDLRLESEMLGFPLIVKPVRGASSEGVTKVASFGELQDVLRALDGIALEIEEYVDGDIYHVDGVVDDDGEVLFLSVSRYIASCLEFTFGHPLGSVVVDGSDANEICGRFARRCLSALGMRSSAFHLELFDTGEELIFLEVGARVAGADVPYVLKDVFGVNLFQLWTEAALGIARSTPSDMQHPVRSGGWLTIPRPTPLPQRVLSARSLLGHIPGLYRELIPKSGDELHDVPGYANLQGGRFLFRGNSQRQVELAIRDAIAVYDLACEPLERVLAPV